MDAKDKLKELAESYGWKFIYARRDYQNLNEVIDFIADEVESFEANETALFCDPITRDATKSDGIVYTGNFMVLTKSDLDMNYDEKVTKFITPALDIINGKMRNNIRCSFEIKTWKSIEVINVFDFNADGVSVQFNLKG